MCGGMGVLVGGVVELVIFIMIVLGREGVGCFFDFIVKEIEG